MLARAGKDGVFNMVVLTPPGLIEVAGEVREISLGSNGFVRVFSEEGGLLTYPLSPTCVAAHEGRYLPSEEVRVGDFVILGVADGQVREISVLDSDLKDGFVEEVNLKSVPQEIAVRLFTGARMKAWVSSGVVVTRKGASSSLKKVRAGDRVSLSLRNGVVTRIEADEAARTIEGIVRAVDERSMRLTIQEGENPEIVLAVSPNARMTYVKEAIRLADVRAGDVVVVKMKGGLASEIRVQDRTPSNVAGKVVRVRSGKSPRITIEPDAGKAVTYDIGLQCAIEFRGLPLMPEDLVPGDAVRVTCLGARATRIEVDSRPMETVSGTLLAMLVDPQTLRYAVRLRTGSGEIRTYAALDGVEVRWRNQRLAPGDLVEGDIVMLELRGRIVTKVTVLFR